jgi:putative membrane protein
MIRNSLFGGVAAVLAFAAAPAVAASIDDAQIAHIAYTAGQIDIAAGRQALARSHDKKVRAFAQEMVRDHKAVNDKALALVTKLGVTPQANPTSTSLSKGAAAKLTALGRLHGRAFDRAYIENEVAYHRIVNGALRDTLIPNAQNGELKSLLQTGLTLFTEHQAHAAHLAAELH